mmetsp:Transcript_66387/g.207895  ORF Transcript_66387/g.207895 Transcript_66387/m.207895 type:complete len:257 (+) Transcript_66387:904-1674(+)
MGGKRSVMAFSTLTFPKLCAAFECMTILAVPTEQPVFPACGGSHQMLSMSAIWISYVLPLVLFMIASATVQTNCPNSGFKASLRMALPAAPAARATVLPTFTFVVFVVLSVSTIRGTVLASTILCTMLAVSRDCASTLLAASWLRIDWPCGPNCSAKLFSCASGETASSGLYASECVAPCGSLKRCDTADMVGPAASTDVLSPAAAEAGCIFEAFGKGTSVASTTSVTGESMPSRKFLSNCVKASCSSVSRLTPCF